MGTEIPANYSTPPQNYNTFIGDGVKNPAVLDVALRAILLITSIVAVVVMVTSKQTKLITFAPGMALTLDAKFNHSSAYIYFVVVLSMACIYSIVTGILSVLALMKTGGSTTKRQFRILILDSLLLAIVATATGATGGVAYIGLKGNSHTRWRKICDNYDSFCDHTGVAFGVSIVSVISLLLLVWLSLYVLSKKIATAFDSKNISVAPV